MTYVPPAVSRWYRWDWQYAADVNKIPFVQEAALFISITPILVFLASAAFPKMNAMGTSAFPLWMLWGAAMAFICARLLYYFGCPKFIREYRDFGQYAARQHSHRWIVWEFYHNLESLAGWRQIVQETSSKCLTVNFDQLPTDIVGRLAPEFEDTSAQTLKVLSPKNIDRDIYLLIYADGKKLALPIREEDPELPKKEKELFWILYSQAAKERPVLRVVYWMLIGVAIGLVFLTAMTKMYLVIRELRS